MRIMLATLCLNEMEWLPWLYAQHNTWPGLVGWAFVEAADREYARVNPAMVTHQGLSRDGTSAFLRKVAQVDWQAHYIPFGFTEHPDPAQGKCAARSAYLETADQLQPDWVIVLDADEFYTRADQRRINEQLAAIDSTEGIDGVLLRQRHLWRPPSLIDMDPFHAEVCGGYWNIPHCRIWRWRRGMRYSTNHNTPFPGGFAQSSVSVAIGTGDCVHMGFASSLAARASKHRYYEARGEGSRDHRGWYVECRAAWERWKIGDDLPHGAYVKPYDGPIPEVFL